MKEIREQIEKVILERNSRLQEIELNGVAAMSQYDITIAHQGNAEQAVATAKMLLKNQIAYFTKQLAEMPATQKPLF